MATYAKRGSRIKAGVWLKGIRESRSFESMGAARAWATQREAEILSGDRGEIPDKTFGDLMERYVREVAPGKKGYRWEAVRVALVLRDPIAGIGLRRLDSTHVAAWRDRRLAGRKDGDRIVPPVAPASVRREWNLLSAAANIAIREWKWLKVNPFTGVRRPKNAKHRERFATEDELERLATAATTPALQRAHQVFLFSVETGMRASEVCGLTRERVNGSVAHLPDTKNGNSRDVPLSGRAREILAALPEGAPDAPAFGITPAQLDAHWRRLTSAAGVKNLHFHDSRHTACLRLSKKLNTLQLTKMLGITDPRILMVYFNETAADIAPLL